MPISLPPNYCHIKKHSNIFLMAWFQPGAILRTMLSFMLAKHKCLIFLLNTKGCTKQNWYYWTKPLIKMRWRPATWKFIPSNYTPVVHILCRPCYQPLRTKKQHWICNGSWKRNCYFEKINNIWNTHPHLHRFWRNQFINAFHIALNRD